MRVVTQNGLLDINPADVVSIRPVSVQPDNMEYCDLTYCVELEDDSEPYGSSTVCVSDSDAKALSRESGIKIPEEKSINRKKEGRVYVPLNELFTLSEWEKYFDGTIARKKEAKPEPVPKSAPSSSFSDGKTLYEENYQPVSLIEQVFRAQNNCIECGKLVFDESRMCSGCIGRAGCD